MWIDVIQNTEEWEKRQVRGEKDVRGRINLKRDFNDNLLEDGSSTTKLYVK